MNVCDNLSDLHCWVCGRYLQLLGFDYKHVFSIEIVPSEEIVAIVQQNIDVAAIQVSRGTILKSCALFEGTFRAQSSDRVVDLALTWLILHELQHFDLGHFNLLCCDYFTETERAHDFALVGHRPPRPYRLTEIDETDRWKIEPCLEMQADHDAIELMLDAYGPEGWDELRQRAAAISAMMVLIEKHDEVQRFEYSSHPKAATRIFQLLGHMIQMPTLPAKFKAEARGDDSIDPADLPSDEEQAAFTRDVVLPAIEDAKALADAADARSIIEDLGNIEDFIADVQLALLEGTAGHGRFKTTGAKQWAELYDFNSVLMERLGHR